ncbi:hypothetical protein K435DRAFT_788912 [Dendrothele bispora CBS 962.96]|uniref:Uncharacterized protein n=1 Tax=Dendrothele bispora (strain CBS 962.96) TaxID=1314807 RepID=A0A4S8MV60_DENBC|nr:hypothetical protein K435DRAFT_788912 [Dendrothele bispora CBS 962.96]
MFAYLAVCETIILALTIFKAGKHGQSRSHSSFIFKFFLYVFSYNIVALTSTAANIISRTALAEGYTALFLGQPYIPSSPLACFYIFVKKQQMQPYPQLNSVRVSRQLVTVDEGQSWFGGPFERSLVSIE